MKRTTSPVVVGLAGATVAVGLALFAVSVVGGPPPTAPSATGAGSGAGSSARPPAPAAQATPGGTVYASCRSGVPVLAAAPAEGWRAAGSPDRTRVQFSDGVSAVEVSVDCSSGAPRFGVAGPYVVDSGRRGGDDGPVGHRDDEHDDHGEHGDD